MRERVNETAVNERAVNERAVNERACARGRGRAARCASTSTRAAPSSRRTAARGGRSCSWPGPPRTPAGGQPIRDEYQVSWPLDQSQLTWGRGTEPLLG